MTRIREEDFTIEYVLDKGIFEAPCVVTNRLQENNEEDVDVTSGIMLPTTMNLNEISEIIGELTEVKLIDVETQTEVNGFCLSDYVLYLQQRTSEHKTLNLISLEISSTALANRVQAPEVVRLIDWIDNVWPLRRRSRGDYPQVQKYCLIGMAGAYTDFHVDFGGTSVWYQVCSGAKRFFLVPPTQDNLLKFSEWMCSPTQDQTFFADMLDADQCYVIELEAGSTLMIPSGWIHAVYTREDSLVFGGNFLHSLAIVKQLQVYVLEQRAHVSKAYRFPQFRQIHMYALCESLRVFRQHLDSGSCESADSTLLAVLLHESVLRQIPYLVRMCKLWSQSQEAAERVYFEQAADAALGLDVAAVFSSWWRLLTVHAMRKQDNALLLIVESVQHSDTLDMFHLELPPTETDEEPPPPPPIDEDPENRKLIIKKRKAPKPPVLRLKLKSRKLKEATTQVVESTGPYSTRGLKLTSAFLSKSTGGEDYESDDDYDNESQEDDEADGDDYGEEEEDDAKPVLPRAVSTGSKAPARTSGGSITKAPKKPTVRQNILKKLGFKR